MAYNILLSDGSTIITVEDNVINTADTSLKLPGKNAQPYGDSVLTSLLHMLENFSSDSAPSNPLSGQVWFDSNNDSLKVFDGTSWLEVLTASSAGEYTLNGNLTVTGDVTANVFHGDLDGTASSSEYADLAERYHSDASYPKGTVVKIGGENEITQTTSEQSNDVFGVISKNPGFMLNSKAGGDTTHPYVALSGRVPVRVIGPVEKGSRIISSYTPGVAVAIQSSGILNQISPYCIIGRALETDYSQEERLILCAVGVK